VERRQTKLANPEGYHRPVLVLYQDVKRRPKLASMRWSQKLFGAHFPEYQDSIEGYSFGRWER
jgi:hypothetical protein